MEKRTLTIEEMIAAGASWADISTRVKEMQREHDAKKKAEAKEKEAAIARERAAAVARERFVTAFADWGIAEGFIAEEDRAEFMGSIEETVDTILEDMRHVMIIKKIFGQR